jgi:hypothetical protein
MKKFLTIVLTVVSMQVFAQTYPITGINILLPSSPEPNIANWGAASSWFAIRANAQPVNGRINPAVEESRILVTIKRDGNKICGAYSAGSAPAADFKTPSKVWRGSSAVSLFGKECILPQGDYEICVQFFGNSNGKPIPLSDEKTKAFTIRGNDQQEYQSKPDNGAAIVKTNNIPVKNRGGDFGREEKNKDQSAPATYGVSVILNSPVGQLKQGDTRPVFKWNTDNSRPGVSYSLKVVELYERQSPEAAIKTNTPILEESGIKETRFPYPSSVKPIVPGKKYTWAVTVLDGNGRQVGQGAPAQFSAGGCDVNLTLKLQSVTCLPATRGNNYKICVSATYLSSAYNLTYASAGGGFKAYAPSYSPVYAVSGLSPGLQVQNSGASTTVNYCFDVNVPAGQTAIKIGLQGDDKDPGPIVCQPGAELDVRLPECNTCGCGTWSPLTVNRITKYQCGVRTEIPWKCGQPFNFISAYQCSPNNESCQAKTSWVIAKDGTNIKTGNGTGNIGDSFTPAGNGTYTLTLNAVCNGIDCPPCIYTIVVKDCKTCDCGTWGTLNVRQSNGLVIAYKCGSRVPIRLACNQQFNFTNSYQCSSTNEACQAATSWEVTSGNTVISTGNGTNTIAGNFTPAGNGNYTLTLNAVCNGIKCPPCTYTFVVNNCPEPCPQLCNGDFEQILNGQAPTGFVQTNQDNIPCWKTTASDGEIEIWHSGFGSVQANTNMYFAEINATMTGTLYQTFTNASAKTIVISFAHRGRYSGVDVMKVSLVPASGPTIQLGTYSDNDSGWRVYNTSPTPIPAGVYKLQFESISSDGGKGPANGGNFLDSVNINCVDVPRGK